MGVPSVRGRYTKFPSLGFRPRFWGAARSLRSLAASGGGHPTRGATALAVLP